MKIVLAERVTTSTRTLHLKDGPTIECDKTAGKKKDFQVEKVIITESSVGSTTISLWGNAKFGGVTTAVRKTYTNKKDLPKWLDKMVRDGFDG